MCQEDTFRFPGLTRRLRLTRDVVQFACDGGEVVRRHYDCLGIVDDVLATTGRYVQTRKADPVGQLFRIHDRHLCVGFESTE